MRDFTQFSERFGWPTPPAQLPLCIGHRGASGHCTENTLAAFRCASEMGAEMWELDTQCSSDGIVMVSHDDHLLRVFGVDAYISKLTASEIADLADVDVPTFSEVAALARELGAGLYIELKAAGTGQPCWRELVQHNQRFAALGSFDPRQIRELRDSGCDYPLAVLVGTGHDPHMLGNAAGADILHLCWERASSQPQDLVTDTLLDTAFASKREIILWHEERLDVMSAIKHLPVLAICTNLPETMRSTDPQGITS